MSEVVREWVHRLPAGEYEVRVWCRRLTGPDPTGKDLRVEAKAQVDAIRAEIEALSPYPSHVVVANVLAERIAALPFCAAVEVMEEREVLGGTSGLLVYPEWP